MHTGVLYFFFDGVGEGGHRNSISYAGVEHHLAARDTRRGCPFGFQVDQNRMPAGLEGVGVPGGGGGGGSRRKRFCPGADAAGSAVPGVWAMDFSATRGVAAARR